MKKNANINYNIVAIIWPSLIRTSWIICTIVIHTIVCFPVDLHWLQCMDNSHILLNSHKFFAYFCANYLASSVTRCCFFKDKWEICAWGMSVLKVTTRDRVSISAKCELFVHKGSKGTNVNCATRVADKFRNNNGCFDNDYKRDQIAWAHVIWQSM